MKKRLTHAAGNRRRLAASMMTALLLASAPLALNQGNAFAVSVAAPSDYEKVVERQDVSHAVRYLRPAGEINLPNGLRDVVLDEPYIESGVWTLPLFFRGNIRGKSFDSKNSIFTLLSGTKIAVVSEPADGSWKYSDADGFYTRGDGARFGYEDFQLPAGMEDGGLKCGDISFGIVRLDAAGKPLWRKTYVKLVRNVSDDMWGYCEHYPHQSQIVTQSTLVGFGDDTIGVLVAGSLIRVSADTGMPVGPVSDVKVFDSAKVAAARSERYLKMSRSDGKEGISEAEYYKLETQYFFPGTK
jgi:hypothetical protein